MIMKAKSHREVKRTHAKTILRLPDLDIAKAAVINSLSCPNAQRGYRHAIDEFVDWYCSEPRLSFSKTVVVRYRMHLDSRHLTLAQLTSAFDTSDLANLTRSIRYQTRASP